MNGATTELWATTIKTPKKKRVISIGRSHQRLLLAKKVSNSAITPTLMAAFGSNLMLTHSWGFSGGGNPPAGIPRIEGRV
jgi:hypothetical protein